MYMALRGPISLMLAQTASFLALGLVLLEKYSRMSDLFGEDDGMDFNDMCEQEALEWA